MSAEWQELLDKSVNDIVNDPLFNSLGGRSKKKRSGGVYSVTVKDAGLELMGDLDDKVQAVFFHADGHEQLAGFAQPLPHGLEFSDSRDIVRKKLGKPFSSAGGKIHPVFGKQPESDRFDFSLLSRIRG